MTPSERKIAAELLELASDSYSNHGCNDFQLEVSDENLALLKAADIWSSGVVEEHEPYQGKLWAQDWLLMGYFAHLLKREVEP